MLIAALDNVLLWIITPRVGRDDDALGHAEQFPENTELLHDTRVGLILFTLPNLPGQEDER